MSRPAAPKMPTPKQIRDAIAAVREVCPDARIAGIGPDGVRFDYSGPEATPDKHTGQSFTPVRK